MHRIKKPRQFVPLSLILPINVLVGLAQANGLALIVAFVIGSYLVRSYYASLSATLGDIPGLEKAIADENRKSGGVHVMAYMCPAIALVMNCTLPLISLPEAYLTQAGGGLIGMASGAGLSYLMVWNERA